MVFSWFEYPDRTARDAANGKLIGRSAYEGDGRSHAVRRQAHGGFDTTVDERGPGTAGYTDGRADYQALAKRMAGKFKEYGAVRILEAGAITAIVVT